MGRSQGETKALFNSWASSYEQDLENPSGILEGHEISLPTAAQVCKISSGMNVLDIGIGTGKFASMFEEKGVSISGVDISEEMIGECKKLHHDYNLQIGVFQDLPYDEKAFDAVISSFCFHEVPPEERLKACQEMYRVINTGGYACILDIMFVSKSATLEARSALKRYWDDSEDYALIGELNELLYSVGFHSIQWIQTRRYHWMFLAYK